MPYAIVPKGKYLCRVLCTFIAGNPALFIAVPAPLQHAEECFCSHHGFLKGSLGYARGG